MNYLIAVLSQRISAEDAYSALLQANFPVQQITILGQGFQGADEFGLIYPKRQAVEQAQKLAYWVVPFGFAAGYLFNLLTRIIILSGASDIVNHLVGGLFGAMAGALGALLVGWIVAWTTSSKDAMIYRNDIKAGKYLIVVKGSEDIIEQATKILRQFELENLQNYTEPIGA